MFTQKITPNPNISCKPGWCLEYVRRTFGQPAVAGYGTATAAWEKSPTKHRDRNFPAGVAVPVWYGLANEPAGHVVLRMSDGSVYSTSDLGNIPHHHPDLADLERYYARYGMPLTYRGWTEDIQGSAVITASGISPQGTVTKKDGFDMAEVNDVVDAIFAKKFQKSDGSGPVNLQQIVEWYDQNRRNDVDEIFGRKITRGGGVPGETSLQATLAYQDANLTKLAQQNAAQSVQIEKLVGALAAVSTGQPFDQAKLLASISAAVKASLPTTVTFK